MLLLKTGELIKLTGITAARLKYLDEAGKLLPYKRSGSVRYYKEEQIIEVLQYMNKAAEVAYVCVEYTNNKYVEGNLDKVNDLIKKKELQMRNCITNFSNNKNLVFASDILINRDFTNTSLEMLAKKAILGAIKKIYINTEIGFPIDLIPEYTKWFSYVHVDLIDLAKLHREGNNKEGAVSNE